MAMTYEFRSWRWRSNGVFTSAPYSKTGNYDYDFRGESYSSADYPVKLYPFEQDMPKRRTEIPIWP